MPTTDRDIQALTYLAGRLRDETHGCRKWDDAGTFANLKAELAGTNLTEAIRRVVGHATDPEARTPGAIKRPFVPETKPESKHAHPLRRAEECPAHPGQPATNCGGCATDQRAYDGAPRPTSAWEPGDATAGAQAAREALLAARGEGA